MIHIIVKICRQHHSIHKIAVSIYSRQLSGLWRYFLINTQPITHTHFVQIAEPSKVAVRQPSPQRTSLAVISKYAQTPLIPPLRSLCTVSLFSPIFCCRHLASKKRL